MKEQHIIEVDKDLCIGCGFCENDCPVNNIIIKDKKSVIKDQDCIKCGHCGAICPTGAITLTGFNEAAIEFEKQCKEGLNRCNSDIVKGSQGGIFKWTKV